MPSMKKNAKGGGMDKVFNKLLKDVGGPVDFELPDRLRKSKLTPYTFIKRNIYLTKKNKKLLEDDGIFCPCTSSAAGSSEEVCDKDCLCGMLQSSCSSNCNCGSTCLNKPFHKRPAKKMKVVQTEKCGSGIVADEDIKQGDFIIEYVGEVIDDKTCEERLWRMKHRGETNFYLCEINRDMVIDATYKGNKSRYINHSCCPNTEMQKWSVDGERRIGIFATREIKKGEHLNYDYQFVQFGADQDCHCGATTCRQKLGVRHNKLKTLTSNSTIKIVERATSSKSKTVSPQKEKPNRKMNFVKGKCQGGGSCSGISRRQPAAKRRRPHNCIDKIVTIIHSRNKRSFGVVKRFDGASKRHLIMFEDGRCECLDLSKERWEFC